MSVCVCVQAIAEEGRKKLGKDSTLREEVVSFRVSAVL